MSIPTQANQLKAPFPAFGGKRRAAAIVWPRLGDVANYIEPFCFSAAMLLCRPHPPRIETINDIDPYVANFWRATEQAAEEVVRHADGPVNEVDLHARHRWLVLSDNAAEFRQRMRNEPDYFDAKIAGWWCWGLCCWIGSGWCSSESEIKRKAGSTPALAGSDGMGQGVVRSTWDQLPNIAGWNGDGSGNVGAHAQFKNQLPCLSGDAGASGRGVHASAGPNQQRPSLADPGGLHAKIPANKKPLLNAGGNAVETPGRGIHGVNSHNRPQLGDAYSRGRGVHGNDHAGTCEQRRDWLLNWFAALRDRLRTTRVCCGSWKRVCDSHSVTTRLGVTGVFLDPPYPTHEADGTASRDASIYASDAAGRDSLDELRDDVLAWCQERGSDPLMRIAVCGYDTDGYAVLDAEGWTVVAWKAAGGYGNRGGADNANAKRERIWFSPHCLDPDVDAYPLFRGLGVGDVNGAAP